ncbi:MAG: hypothetical protein IT395_03450, partial [Candidatus Omnitrophica bacterium]|nr:hypothetical protein [Candidatus Omnitrophota bacterium]
TTFNDLTKMASAVGTLTFEQGKTQVITGALNLQGQSAAQRLALRSTFDGTAWNLFPTLSVTVANLDVKDSNAVVVDPLNCGVGCLDSLGNTNWFFPAPPPVQQGTGISAISLVAVEQTIGTLPIEIPGITFDPREFPTNRGKGGRSLERFEKVWATEPQSAGRTTVDFEGASFTGELGSLPAMTIPAGTVSTQETISADFISGIIAR